MEKQQKEPKINTREAGMMTCAGAQGVGKTYQNMHLIKDYLKDKVHNKVRGRKVLILDTNGEYTEGQFAENDIDNFPVKKIALKDIEAWGKSDLVECRRIDAKNLSIKEKKEAIYHIIKVYRNGMLVLEDINTYILSMTHMEEIVGGLVNLRHRAVDVLISYQSLRAVEPIIWRNSRWVRMHYQADDVNDIKGKVTDPALFKIAQYIVNSRYHDGDKRIFVVIHNLDRKVEGEFSLREFDQACLKYINTSKKLVKEYMTMYNVDKGKATVGQVKQFRKQYYGN